MGVDLRLLPFDCDQGEFAYSHTILEVGRDYDLHNRIKALPALPVPKGFNSFSGRREDYDDICYGRTNETAYGEELKYVLARDLCAIKLSKDASDRQRAVWAYLKELTPLTKVALYWH